MMRKAFTTVGAPNLCRAMASAAAPTKLEGKVVLITAATQGLGLAAARRVAQEGAKVMICSRKQANVDEALEQLHKEGLTNIHGIQCHVSDEQQRQNLIDKTVKDFGGIDSLVHCAGISPCPGPVLEHTSKSFDKIVDVNLKSALQFAQLVRPHMNARNGGTIVFLSSGTAYQTTPAMLGVYPVVKLALLGLTKEVAKEVAEENIRVNCIAAGSFNTKYGDVMKVEPYSGYLMSGLLIKRFGEPEEMAGTVSFLISEDSSYMTGEIINVTGGLPTRI